LKPGSIQNIQNSKTARDNLHKLAHNINGARSGMSTAAQLLSSNAHASNPTVLAQSFAMSRPTLMTQHKAAFITAQQSNQNTLKQSKPSKLLRVIPPCHSIRMPVGMDVLKM
jgi:hypothetical protein